MAPVLPGPAPHPGVQVLHRSRAGYQVKDVVGLYLHPPDNAVVLCVDEKSQCQALERTQPILPLRPGIPERHTHDYARHGVTCLFAALNAATGQVADACYPRHRHQEFLKFLKKTAAAYPGTPLHIVRQLCHAQAPGRPQVAGPAGEPADHSALHANQLLLARPRGMLLSVITRQAIRRGSWRPS